MNDGDEAIFYFRGRMEGDYDPASMIDLDDDGAPEFDDEDEEALLELAQEMGCCGYTEESDLERLQAVISRRVKDELEPFQQVKHYFATNKGKQGRELFLHCGDEEAAINAKDWKFETECRPCFVRMSGVKNISAQLLYTWTVYDTRVVHKISAGEGRRRKTRTSGRRTEEKDAYEPCTLEAKGRCQHCSHNRKLDRRDQDDISIDELRELLDDGWRRRYYNGNRLLELPDRDYARIEDLMEQAATMCRNCGDGKIRVTGAVCSDEDCQEEFDLDEMISHGVDPEDSNARVSCEECGEVGRPNCVFECDECDDPTPARLSDVPVRAKMTLEGKDGKQRVWSFSIAGNPEPLTLGDDPKIDRIIAARMPDVDEITKAPSIAKQVETLGLAEDPITGEEVEDDDEVSDAPTMGKAARLAAKSKGGKSKGGKSKSKGGKVKRRSGFLRAG